MVEQIYNYIRQDLVRNQEDILNMSHYYTHKYRSRDRRLDMNVGIFTNENREDIVQIYVADKFTRIREQMVIKNNKIIDSRLIIKNYE